MIDDLLRRTPPGPRPPEDGFVHAMLAARRRRWRTLGNTLAAGSAALAAVFATALPRLPTGSLAGLQPAEPGIRRTSVAPTASSAPTPSPSATPPAEEPGFTSPREVGWGGSGGGVVTGSGSGYGAGSGRGSGAGTGGAPADVRTDGPAPADGDGGQPAGPVPAGSGPGSGPAPTPGGDPAPQESPAPPEPSPSPTDPPPSPSPAPRPGPQPVDLTYEDQPVDSPCEGSAGWCVSAQVGGAAGDGTRSLRLRACRPTSDTQGVLRYSHEIEADFRVLRDGRQVWQWSIGQPNDGDVHEVFVDRWQCAVWSTPWARIDQDGNAVAPGRYQLSAQPRATNLPTTWRATTFDVT